MNGKHTAEFYLKLEPQWNQYGKSLRGIKATGISQRAPGVVAHGTVVVKIAVSLADSAFLPLYPVVSIDVPDEHVLVVEATSLEAEPA